MPMPASTVHGMPYLVPAALYAVIQLAGIDWPGRFTESLRGVPGGGRAIVLPAAAGAEALVVDAETGTAFAPGWTSHASVLSALGEPPASSIGNMRKVAAPLAATMAIGLRCVTASLIARRGTAIGSEPSYLAVPAGWACVTATRSRSRPSWTV